MRRTLPTPALKTILLGGAILATITGCTQTADSPIEVELPKETSIEAAPGVEKLAFNALPEVSRTAQDPCPYLDTQWVADTNGQRMTGFGVDNRFETPACVFWSFPEEPQLTVIVRTMDTEDDAIAVVDWAAPIDSTEPAEEPSGWSGGRSGSTDGSGALYAVQKGNSAVVVFSNQDQSLKAQLVAAEVIKNLAL